MLLLVLNLFISYNFRDFTDIYYYIGDYSFKTEKDIVKKELAKTVYILKNEV